MGSLLDFEDCLEFFSFVVLSDSANIEMGGILVIFDEYAILL
jgi:hypothetical protein